MGCLGIWVMGMGMVFEYLPLLRDFGVIADSLPSMGEDGSVVE